MASTSYQSIYTSPVPVKAPYNPAKALDDIPSAAYALNLFLSSKMVEAEEYMSENDKKRQRLYFASAVGLIQCMKGVMSFADEDLLAALEHTKQCVVIASQHRKKAPYLTSRLAGYVVSSLNTTGVGWIKTMTDVERHAELIYAESLVEKAIIGIVYSGDWLAFIKEALNLRTVIGIYRTLYKYITTVDAEYAASATPGERIESPAIDAHFRSGVYLGTGLSSLIISLLPARVINLVEMFGYAADRAEALDILGRAGGWGGPSTSRPSRDSEKKNDSVDGDRENVSPDISTAQEGARRALCDLALVVFHLALGSFTFECVDVSMAARIVNWNLKRYPEGVFFLFFAGLLSTVRCQPAHSIAYHRQAIAAQSQYRNLHHISYWEMALANMNLADVEESLACWRVLEKEATWSKCIYTYGMAVCLLASSEGEVKEEDGTGKRKEEAMKLMERVPELRQKIAGKSIPLEKFVARKARKCLSQKGRLLLPTLELSAVFSGIARAPPRSVIEERMLPSLRAELVNLKEKGESAQGYWDDWCLAKYLEGLCLRYVAFPNSDDVLGPEEEVPQMARDDAAKASREAFEAVFEHGEKIEFDHYVVYNSHFELGRLLARLGDEKEARRHFELVLSGKYLEVGPSGRKGKYSMQNALHVRTNAALEGIHTKRL
ncbi:hypothetical protein FB45DRAFT_939423 [Roridomyces roridus]|uniref:Tetratricopeptide repeat protein 39B n=1 Tax=Roridomyces roridus TaxID=1738132 RepID=A0AAD7B7R1_9AGAR|nr:hypothetical protein FB45DRAFT_939423 [Roridomyces roridus]